MVSIMNPVREYRPLLRQIVFGRGVRGNVANALGNLLEQYVMLWTIERARNERKG